jgi:MHS family proline/betaine transporter-like MFS transporter
MVSEEVLRSYAWRIPFFVSVIGSMTAFYMRRNLLETQDFIAVKQENKIIKNPLWEMLKNHKSVLAGLFAIFLTTQVSFFVVFIFGKTMMINFLHYDSHTAGKFNLFTVMSYTVSTLVFGYLSDHVNKRYIILTGAFGLLCSIYPFIMALEAGSSSTNILLLSILLGALIGMTEGTLNPVVAESFPANIRATSVAFCWNFTSVAFGGTAPIIAMWLIENTGGVSTVAYYMMAMCFVTIVGVIYNLTHSAKISAIDEEDSVTADI